MAHKSRAVVYDPAVAIRINVVLSALSFLSECFGMGDVFVPAVYVLSSPHLPAIINKSTDSICTIIIYIFIDKFTTR